MNKKKGVIYLLKNGYYFIYIYIYMKVAEKI